MQFQFCNVLSTVKKQNSIENRSIFCVFRSLCGIYFLNSYGFAGNISQMYICDIHREQAQERWLAKYCNGLTDRKQSILAKLRAVARARTEQEYLEKLNDLKKQRRVEDKRQRHGSCNTRYTSLARKLLLVFPLSKVNFVFSLQKWVCAFKKDRLLTTINTNNGTEGFKHEYLEGHQQATLSCYQFLLKSSLLTNTSSKAQFFSQ